MTQETMLERPDGRIQTRFGEFEVPHPQVVAFPDGIPGFEACRRFVLILADELSPLSCLQALDPPYPSFLAADPLTICPDYQRRLGPVEQAALEAGADDSLIWLVILTLELHEVRVNLKAPIVINARRMIGRQVVLEDTAYSVNWRVDAR